MWHNGKGHFITFNVVCLLLLFLMLFHSFSPIIVVDRYIQRVVCSRKGLNTHWRTVFPSFLCSSRFLKEWDIT